MIDHPAIAASEALRRLHQGVVVPDYEQLLIQTYSNFVKEGAVAVDVGAHAGRHTEYLARFAGNNGKVMAFEPIPSLFEGLAEKFRDNPTVDLRRFALAKQPGECEFNVVDGEPEQSGLKERVFSRDGLSVNKIMVQVSTLDEQLSGFDKIDYIKVDVEGAEIDCLLGAKTVLTTIRPLVSVEYGKPSYSVYGHTAITLFDIASEYGYVVSDLFANVMETPEVWLQVCDRSYWDYMLVPKERVQWWQSLFRPG